MRPRWKRCVDYTDNQLGEALGRKYVEKTFGADGKERTLKMVAALEKAMGEDLEKLPWMTATTKKEALIKLHAITNKIGYPDKWRDYSSVVIKRDDHMGNGYRCGRVRVPAAAGQDRQAGRSAGVGHDSADRERLLRSADEQHQLPRRNSTAAVLRQDHRRRGQLRRASAW